MTFEKLRTLYGFSFTRGSRVQVNGRKGTVTGTVSGLHVRVKFDDKQLSSPCHPLELQPLPEEKALVDSSRKTCPDPGSNRRIRKRDMPNHFLMASATSRLLAMSREFLGLGGSPAEKVCDQMLASLLARPGASYMFSSFFAHSRAVSRHKL
ncbi:hypothetical protein [Variovorax sp. CY25R-8]|uniref:hypothetical protein n=1 Tax=Variovorax sp. CY25R-8 TaxID=2855501 RepID=UPI0021BB6B25|nr:hypothetical protein [Variovorax sp. CY25R-8]MCT8180533.1 hypothetical protein [Variovorax sp. CY25R-8]